LNFPNQFEGEKEDKNLPMKLTTETELSGLLNLALAGLSRLQKNQSYSYTKSVDETTELYQRAADPVFAFLLDTCEVSPGEWVAKGQLYELFKLYCEKHRIPILKPNSFARALQNQTQIKVSSTRPEVDGKRITAWQGVKCVKDVKDVNVSPLLKPSETKSNTHNKDNGIKVSLRYRNNIDIPDNPDGKPAHPCYACGSDDWWQRPDGGWVCGVCHPKPGEHDEEDEITQFLDEVGREMQPREEPPEEAGEDLSWLQ
jgi:phage/plasmid-associated DNA primase